MSTVIRLPARSIFDGEKYEKLKLKDLQKRPLDTRLAGGWIASIQHHFVTAVVPPAEEQFQYTQSSADRRYRVYSAPSAKCAASRRVRASISIKSCLSDQKSRKS